MTHDELLEKIIPEQYDESGSIMVTYGKALRAVVELHKPITHKGYEREGFFCSNCEFDYPCPTIQAIEKE